MALHILGIRHHGVGSARRVLEQLETIKPDIILIEGPPEISDVLSVAGDVDLVPPVALMVYNQDKPGESVFYPFAEYSPEWVAALYANQNKIPVRAIDLPAAVGFQKRYGEGVKQGEQPLPDDQEPLKDPVSFLAEIDGYTHGEDWWNDQFEDKIQHPGEDHFEAIMLAMETLRAEGIKSSLDRENIDREAYMRHLIRQAQNEMFHNIVVICGAWHAPALMHPELSLKEDNKIIKALPKLKIKIGATWIPWTNSRLSMFSGYGAGIYSPGWYDHQWLVQEESEIAWLSKVARTFRAKGIDISAAHIIEAYRLAHNLALLRNKSTISLEELNEAILAVMCTGDVILLELIKEKLIIGNKIGKVPDNIPKMPLQQDFEQILKQLKLPLKAEPKKYDLDLRKDLDLQRSIFFHRLDILEIPWMKKTYARTKGTFKESWVLEWSPGIMVQLIDKAYLGNTIVDAAHAIILQRCAGTAKISEVSDLIRKSLPAELFGNIDHLLSRINELSAISSDITDLMMAIPQLVNISRYGDVRKSDLTVLNTIVQQLLVKVFIGLPNACYGLDDINSGEMIQHVLSLNQAVKIYDEDAFRPQWYETLHKLINKDGVHSIIHGGVCRLLLDAMELTEEEADKRISFHLSVAHNPFHVAYWLEGFLMGNGMILIYDNKLWNLLYVWVSSLPRGIFMEILPLLRRAFSKFEYAERRQIG
jgi:hypothetical protein